MILKYEFRRNNFICPEEQFTGPLGGQQIAFRRISDFSEKELITLINEYPRLAERYFEWFEVREKQETTTNEKGKGKLKKKMNESIKATSNTATDEEAETPEDTGDSSQ